MKEPMELLKEKLIFIDVEAKDREEAIGKMAKELYKKGYVKESYINAILDREKVFPTGLPTEEVGVAIPHTDSCQRRCHGYWGVEKPSFISNDGDA